jgi:heme/copper-type cytochrome/quinol oxidase subunit 4
MRKSTKILLSIPSFLVLSYMVTLWFPTKFLWLAPTMNEYYIQIFIIQGLTIIQLIFLIKKLWSFKNLEKSKKSEWTWILILFSSISSLIFIWNKVDEFEVLNKNTISSNNQN